MAIAMTSQCLLCHFKRYLTKAQGLGDEKTAMEFGRAMMQTYLNAPAGVSSPWFSPQVAELFKKYYHLGDNQYEEEKRQANAFAMERLEQMRSMIRQAEDPILAGLRLAILGNYLDFGALQGQVSFEKMEEMLRQAMEMELDMEVFASLRQALANGKKLLFLTYFWRIVSVDSQYSILFFQCQAFIIKTENRKGRCFYEKQEYRFYRSVRCRDRGKGYARAGCG